MKPWSTLFRNRRGALCTVCCCLVFAVLVLFSTWSARCFLDRRLYDLPNRIVEVIVALGAVKGWQYRQDGNEAKEDAPGGR